LALTIGQQLGSLEITALLGKGGMGEVYRARDTKLKREVAIKILPEEFSRDPDRVARFQREAEVLASLNHPNIAAIYDLEEAEGSRLLVLEFVEGETLADRMKRGPLPVEEALQIGKSICEALEAAHEKGIVHRDLKPANVKITPDGKVKVLDFGLAKAMENAPPQASLSNSPTLSAIQTAGGVILGTAAYMSPEQAKGASTDQRSDIFSFGCVLHEMLTGRQTFQADTVTETIAAVLMREPDLQALPAKLRPRTEELIRRCLAKNRKERWHAIDDVRLEIDSILAEPQLVKTATGAATAPLSKRAAAVVFGAALGAIFTAAVLWSTRPAPPPRHVVRYGFTLPKDQDFTRPGRQVVAISRDGTNLVYAANKQLYLKSVGEMESRPIPGTNQDPDVPMFSPDGQWVAFYAVPEGKLKKIPLAGGTSVTLAEMIDNPFGASWGSDDKIILGQGGKGIVSVPATGGKPEIVIPAKSDELLDGPQLLPKGQYLLFTVAASATRGASNWDTAQVVVQNLKSGARKVVIEAGSDARYIPTGQLIYAVGATLFAVPFDLNKLQVTGGPVPVLEGVRRSNQSVTAAAFFALSDEGSLIWIPDVVTGTVHRILALVDRSGGKKVLPLPAADYNVPRISPDGKHLAVGIADAKDFNIWIYDLNGNTSMRRLTFGGRNQNAVWTRDSKRVVFRSDRDGEGLYWQAADGSGAAERLSTTEKNTYHAPVDWTPDGKALAFYVNYRLDRGDIWTLSPDGDRKPKPLVTSPSKNLRRLNFSPDGRWMAYGSNEESEGGAIYVQPFPPTGAKYKISAKGGADSPVWSPDGRQLIFASGSRLMSVDVQTQPAFTFSEPKPLPIEIENTHDRPYDITPDGKQFLVMQRPPESETPEKTSIQINAVLNWFDELKRRIPVH
jgi:serine/threonine-protein kinase